MKFGTTSWEFMLAIGLLVLPSAYYEYLNYQQDSQKLKQLELQGVQTQGTVIGNKFILARIASSFRPIIRFQTQEGIIIEAIDYSGWAMAIPRFTKGTKVTIRYDPVDPTNFERL